MMGLKSGLRQSYPALGLTAGLVLTSLFAGAQAEAAEGKCLVGGTVYTPAGPASDLVVCIKGNRISAVGDMTLEGYASVNIEGKILTPGLIAVDNHLGLVEVGMEDFTVDGEAPAEGEFHPAFQVAPAYNPRSTLIPVVRMGGVTSAITVPSGGFIAGQSAWVDLTGLTQKEAVIHDRLAMHSRFMGGETSRSTIYHGLKDAFEETRLYQAHRSAIEGNRYRRLSMQPADYEALAQILAGDMPLVVRADRASEIEALIRLAQDEGVKMVIAGGAESHFLASELAEAGIAVMVDPLIYGPGSFSMIYARKDTAKILHEAGVQVIIGGKIGEDAHRAGALRTIAGNAVRGGLDHDAAMKAITQTPAEVFDMRKLGYGIIEPGAMANLVVWSGDPLEISTQVEAIYIHGQEKSLTSRHTALLERYRSLEE